MEQIKKLRSDTKYWYISVGLRCKNIFGQCILQSLLFNCAQAVIIKAVLTSEPG